MIRQASRTLLAIYLSKTYQYMISWIYQIKWRRTFTDCMGILATALAAAIDVSAIIGIMGTGCVLTTTCRFWGSCTTGLGISSFRGWTLRGSRFTTAGTGGGGGGAAGAGGGGSGLCFNLVLIFALGDLAGLLGDGFFFLRCREACRSSRVLRNSWDNGPNTWQIEH